MNKRQAKQQAMHNTRSWGELQTLVSATKTKGCSTVNPGLSKKTVVALFEKLFDDKELSRIPDGSMLSRDLNRITLSSDGVCIMNILRECG
jgi:hypothetical protein